jgi:excinuclease UvrABC ATPase subunit
MHPADRHDLIRIQGARENNLKDVSVELPKRRLTVFTGVSGSGKSSLVFATIAAESAADQRDLQRVPRWAAPTSTCSRD